jgi:hypothetical protein
MSEPNVTSIVNKVPGAPTEDTRMVHSPTMDVRNTGAAMLKLLLATATEESHDPWYNEYMRLTDTKVDDLEKACIAFTYAMRIIHDDPTFVRKEGIGRVFTDAGFFECSLPAQLAVFARIGKLFFSHFAFAVGHNVVETDPWPAQIASLEQYMIECSRQLSRQPRFKWLRDAWQRITGH